MVTCLPHQLLSVMLTAGVNGAWWGQAWLGLDLLQYAVQPPSVMGTGQAVPSLQPISLVYGIRALSVMYTVNIQ